MCDDKIVVMRKKVLTKKVPIIKFCAKKKQLIWISFYDKKNVAMKKVVMKTVLKWQKFSDSKKVVWWNLFRYKMCCDKITIECCIKYSF